MSTPPRAYRRGPRGIVEAEVTDPEAPPETWPIVAVRKSKKEEEQR